jgi:hypothetical protein
VKAAYLGGTRGYQSVIYRPGTGWTGTDRRPRFGRQPLARKQDRRAHLCPLAVAQRRRPGLRTKALIVSTAALVAALLTIALSGGAQL